jgi:hypothetical protein
LSDGGPAGRTPPAFSTFVETTMNADKMEALLDRWEADLKLADDNPAAFCRSLGFSLDHDYPHRAVAKNRQFLRQFEPLSEAFGQATADLKQARREKRWDRVDRALVELDRLRPLHDRFGACLDKVVAAAQAWGEFFKDFRRRRGER